MDKVSYAESLGAERRGDVLHFNPFKVVIVGLDVEDPENVLDDPDRVAESFDEVTVQDVMARGVDTAIKVRRNGKHLDGSPRWEVVFGRGRTMACREAWERLGLKALPAGDPALVKYLLPAGRTDAKDAELAEMILAENLQRREEGPLSAAKKAAKLLALKLIGADANRAGAMKSVAVTCHINVKTLRDWLAMAELAPEVQALVRAKKVSAYAAVDLLRGVDPAEQGAKMRQLIKDGKATGIAAEHEAKRLQRPEAEAAEPEEAGEPAAAKVVLPTRRALRKLRDYMAKVVEAKATFTRTEVVNLLSFALDGKALRGTFRGVWGDATSKKEKPARGAQAPG